MLKEKASIGFETVEKKYKYIRYNVFTKLACSKKKTCHVYWMQYLTSKQFGDAGIKYLWHTKTSAHTRLFRQPLELINKNYILTQILFLSFCKFAFWSWLNSFSKDWKIKKKLLQSWIHHSKADEIYRMYMYRLHTCIIMYMNIWKQIELNNNW